MTGFLWILLIFAILGSFLIGVFLLLRKIVQSFIAKRYLKGLLLTLCFIGVVVLLGSPFGSHPPKEHSIRIRCKQQVMCLSLFMKMYANDHEGQYPASFQDFYGDYVKKDDQKIFTCPSINRHATFTTNVEDSVDYAYVSGLRESDPTNCVAIFCLPSNHHEQGANVGFLDGQAKWFTCHPPPESLPKYHVITFYELTNTPSLFYGTTNEVKLAELMKRTRIIFPKTSR